MPNEKTEWQTLSALKYLNNYIHESEKKIYFFSFVVPLTKMFKQGPQTVCCCDFVVFFYFVFSLLFHAPRALKIDRVLGPFLFLF